jgi:hypothetical protein
VYCEFRINQLRNELHQLIEQEHLDSGCVQKLSQELDALILLYYRQLKGMGTKIF